MPTLFSLLIILLTACAPIQAQDKAASADEVFTNMETELGLTEDQSGAVKPILEKYAAAIQELKDKLANSSNADDMRKLKVMRLQESQELAQVLSAQQLKKWKSLQRPKHQRKDDKEGQGTGANGSGGPSGKNSA